MNKTGGILSFFYFFHILLKKDVQNITEIKKTVSFPQLARKLLIN